jgi:hypothetical protein
MGILGGFIKWDRASFEKRDPVLRISDWKPYFKAQEEPVMQEQAGRCMECGRVLEISPYLSTSFLLAALSIGQKHLYDLSHASPYYRLKGALVRMIPSDILECQPRHKMSYQQEFNCQFLNIELPLCEKYNIAPSAMKKSLNVYDNYHALSAIESWLKGAFERGYTLSA